MKRITIYMGHYGSGKTELSLNKVYNLIKKSVKVILVDLDIVNPYFRSGEHKQTLEKQGVKVIRPNFEGTNVDVPSIPADVMSVFHDKTKKVVFDVGGDASGAAAIGRYHQAIECDDSIVKCVVNVMRPLTTTADEIVEMVNQLEQKSRLKVDELVNNSNLAMDTTPDVIVEGQKIVEKAAEKLKLPIKQIGVMTSVVNLLPKEFKEKYKEIITPIDLHMRLDWMDD